MFRLFVLSLCLALALAAPPAKLSQDSPVDYLQTEVKFVEDINAYRAEHPEIHLEPLNRQATKDRIRYTLGSRVSGDKLVASGANSDKWSSAQNIELTFQYPTSGQGSIVSYVDILVNQSSNVGQAYVVSGGVGRRSIAIVVEAYYTTYFTYVAGIYGY